MGQKVNPTSFRLGNLYTWSSRWFAGKANYKKFLQQDIKIRTYLKGKLAEASVARIDLERSSALVRVTIHSAKPGIIIGRGGTGIEDLKKDIKNTFFASEKVELQVNILEISNPNMSAPLIAQLIATALEKRVPFRKAIKQTIMKVEKSGAQGVKITVGGRLNGVEIARSETLSSGKIPLHTLRADIDYAADTARTGYGAIGIKVWIYKGEVFKDKTAQAKENFKSYKS